MLRTCSRRWEEVPLFLRGSRAPSAHSEMVARPPWRRLPRWIIDYHSAENGLKGTLTVALQSDIVIKTWYSRPDAFTSCTPCDKMT